MSVTTIEETSLPPEFPRDSRVKKVTLVLTVISVAKKITDEYITTMIDSYVIETIYFCDWRRE